jgi:hypothetical protein
VELVDPAATVTEDGTDTVELLLEMLTVIPPLGAAPLRDTEQLSVPGPVKEGTGQLRLLRTDVVLSWMANVWDAPDAEAVKVAVWFEENAETVAVKVALVAPEATVTDDGTETFALLLERFTPRPPFGAEAVNETVQVSVPAPVNAPAVQESALNEAVAEPLEFFFPFPLRLIVVEEGVLE